MIMYTEDGNIIQESAEKEVLSHSYLHASTTSLEWHRRRCRSDGGFGYDDQPPLLLLLSHRYERRVELPQRLFQGKRM
jgi:hypothetical protein